MLMYHTAVHPRPRFDIDALDYFLQDIHLQSEAGQIHLLRIARSNTISAETLQTEFALHSWILKLNSGSSLPFDRAVASSWNRKARISKDMESKEIEDGNDGLAWSLHEVRGGNGSTVADWKGLDENSKVSANGSVDHVDEPESDKEGSGICGRRRATIDEQSRWTISAFSGLTCRTLSPLGRSRLDFSTLPLTRKIESSLLIDRSTTL